MQLGPVRMDGQRSAVDCEPGMQDCQLTMPIMPCLIGSFAGSAPPLLRSRRSRAARLKLLQEIGQARLQEFAKGWDVRRESQRFTGTLKTRENTPFSHFVGLDRSPGPLGLERGEDQLETPIAVRSSERVGGQDSFHLLGSYAVRQPIRNG